MSTKVIFRQFKDGDVIALFPDQPGTNNPSTCSSYMHIGQHSSASVHLASFTKAATKRAYGTLLRELGRIGYRDLRVVKRFTRADYYTRRDS